MEHLIGDNAAAKETSIIRKLFLQHLQNQVRTILSMSTTASISTLARIVSEGREYQMMEVGSPFISAIGQHAPAQVRHMAYISEFIIDIGLAKAADNAAADALSIIGVNLCPLE